MGNIVGHITVNTLDFETPNWLSCQGQLVPVEEFPWLFKILGTRFGGDGVETFGIPNLPSFVDLDGSTLTYVICHDGTFPKQP